MGPVSTIVGVAVTENSVAVCDTTGTTTVTATPSLDATNCNTFDNKAGSLVTLISTLPGLSIEKVAYANPPTVVASSTRRISPLSARVDIVNRAGVPSGTM